MDVACIKCREIAPRLGILGYPSLATGPHKHPSLGEVKGFGWYYAGLRSIHLVTEQVEQFREFLIQHEGHEVRLRADDDEEDDDFGDFTDRQEDEGVSASSASFVTAGITYRCDACAATHSLAKTDRLVDFADGDIPPVEAATVGEWLNGTDLDFETGEWGSELTGALDITEPFFRTLGPFLLEHADHGIAVSLTRRGRLTSG
jgi:hypothetical protein